MKCPICNVDLVMTERQSVEIDYCPTCRGIWLDRGELDKIIERSASANSSNPATSQNEQKGNEDDDEDEEGGFFQKNRSGNPNEKKKSSFLGDMFDF